MRLVLTGYGYYIGKKSGMIVIKRGSEKKAYSVGNLEEIVVHSRGVHFSGEALTLLMRHGVKVYFIDRLKIRGKLTPFRKGSSMFIVKAQVESQKDRRGRYLAKRFIEGKILNQIIFLRQLKRRFRRKRDVVMLLSTHINQLKEVYQDMITLDLDDEDYLMKIISKEGEASRIYWETFSTLFPSEYQFERRKKRFDKPTDPVNISLNYLYTLLASAVWVETELCGLEPYIGFLHKDSTRRPSLVMDIMEEFRVPIVDKPLINHILRHPKQCLAWIDDSYKLKEESIKELMKIFYNRLEEETTFLNRSLKFKHHIHLQCKRLIKYIMGYTNTYTPFKLTK